jgi:anti-sigma B factor antagonist
MFSIARNQEGNVALAGRLDAAQVDKAKEILGALSESTVVDFAGLDYISSAGLGILLATQQRLKKEGKTLKLINMNAMIRNVFRIARFDFIFDIE